MKQKVFPLKRSIKVDRHLGRLIKKRGTLIGNITLDTADTKRVLRKYYKQLYIYNLDNLDEMD